MKPNIYAFEVCDAANSVLFAFKARFKVQEMTEVFRKMIAITKICIEHADANGEVEISTPGSNKTIILKLDD